MVSSISFLSTLANKQIFVIKGYEMLLVDTLVSFQLTRKFVSFLTI